LTARLRRVMLLESHGDDMTLQAARRIVADLQADGCDGVEISAALTRAGASTTIRARAMSGR